MLPSCPLCLEIPRHSRAAIQCGARRVSAVKNTKSTQQSEDAVQRHHHQHWVPNTSTSTGRLCDCCY